MCSIPQTQRTRITSDLIIGKLIDPTSHTLFTWCLLALLVIKTNQAGTKTELSRVGVAKVEAEAKQKFLNSPSDLFFITVEGNEVAQPPEEVHQLVAEHQPLAPGHQDAPAVQQDLSHGQPLPQDSHPNVIQDVQQVP